MYFVEEKYRIYNRLMPSPSHNLKHGDQDYCRHIALTFWPWELIEILQTAFFNYIPAFNTVSRCFVENEAILYDEVAWCRTSHKPPYERMMTMVSDAYRYTSKLSGTLAGNTIVDHSEVVGASPFGTAPTISSISS